MNAHPGPIHRNRLREQEFAIAEQLWREACWAYLHALFTGAGAARLQALADVLHRRAVEMKTAR